MICILSSDVLMEVRASGAAILCYAVYAIETQRRPGRPLAKVRVANLTTNLVIWQQTKQNQRG